MTGADTDDLDPGLALGHDALGDRDRAPVLGDVPDHVIHVLVLVVGVRALALALALGHLQEMPLAG